MEIVTLYESKYLFKDPKDKSTRTYPTENMESSVLQDHPFDPKFVFVQTPRWKNLDSDSKKAFDII